MSIFDMFLRNHAENRHKISDKPATATGSSPTDLYFLPRSMTRIMPAITWPAATARVEAIDLTALATVGTVDVGAMAGGVDVWKEE